MNLSLPPELNMEIQSRIASIMSSCVFVGGGLVKEFENNFAKYIGVDYCIAVGNGTDAIEIAIEALGIKDAEIIVPALTAVPTAEAVVRSGNIVRFCDVDALTLTMDPTSLKDSITDRTQAVIPVHLYGQPCEMDAILQVADEYSLRVIEDCSHAHGATYDGRQVGSIGDIGTFSFYPTKPLGAMGDAGAITTNSRVAYRCKYIRNHGRISRDDFQLIGRNSRMDTLQAAILDAKLPYLDQWNARRFELAICYQERLSIPVQPSQTYHQLVIQVDDRDTVQAKLREAGIDTLIHYPYIVPNLSPYHTDGHWPIAAHASKRILSLPMDLCITADTIDTVVAVLNEGVS